VKEFIREDIYNIFVPIGVVVLGWVFQYLEKDKQWKQTSEKSSSESFANYYVFLVFLGMFWLILYTFLVAFIAVIFDIKISGSIIKVSYTIFSVLPYVFFAVHRIKKKLVFKKDYKYKEILSYVMNVIP